MYFDEKLFEKHPQSHYQTRSKWGYCGSCDIFEG